MRIQFVIKGKDYSINKNDFKKILAKHGLEWKGSMDEPWWGSEKDVVRAHYERDEEKGITLSATLIWEGKRETPFLKELKEWASGLECKTIEIGDVKRSEIDDIIERKLEEWDLLHKPNIDYFRSTSRPEDWIKKDIEKWKKERKAKEKELRASFKI